MAVTRKKRQKPVKGMWLTWLFIFLIVASMIQEFLWMFSDSDMFMWTGLGCFLAGMACIVFWGKE